MSRALSFTSVASALSVAALSIPAMSAEPATVTGKVTNAQEQPENLRKSAGLVTGITISLPANPDASRVAVASSPSPCIATQGAASDAQKRGIKIVEIKGDQSPEEAVAGRAPISTSRSNKMHGVVIGAPDRTPVADVACVAPGTLRDVKPYVAGGVVVRKPPKLYRDGKPIGGNNGASEAIAAPPPAKDSNPSPSNSQNQNRLAGTASMAARVGSETLPLVRLDRAQTPAVDMSMAVTAGGITINHEYGYDGGIFVGYDYSAQGGNGPESTCSRAGGAFNNRSGRASCSFSLPIGARPHVLSFENMRAARESCTGAGGSFGAKRNRLTCSNPVRSLIRRGRFLGGPR